MSWEYSENILVQGAADEQEIGGVKWNADRFRKC